MTAGRHVVGRSATFEKMRQQRAKWMGVIVVLATVIVGISSFLKVRGIPVRPSVKNVESQAN